MLHIESSCPFPDLIDSCFCTLGLDWSIKNSSRRQTTNVLTLSLEKKQQNQTLGPEKHDKLLERVRKYTVLDHLKEQQLLFCPLGISVSDIWCKLLTVLRRVERMASCLTPCPLEDKGSLQRLGYRIPPAYTAGRQDTFHNCPCKFPQNLTLLAKVT